MCWSLCNTLQVFCGLLMLCCTGCLAVSSVSCREQFSKLINSVLYLIHTCTSLNCLLMFWICLICCFVRLLKAGIFCCNGLSSLTHVGKQVKVNKLISLNHRLYVYTFLWDLLASREDGSSVPVFCFHTDASYQDFQQKPDILWMKCLKAVIITFCTRLEEQESCMQGEKRANLFIIRELGAITYLKGSITGDFKVWSCTFWCVDDTAQACLLPAAHRWHRPYGPSPWEDISAEGCSDASGGSRVITPSS